MLRNTCRKAIELLERVQELEELLVEASKPKKKQKPDVAGAAVSTAQADPFSRAVEGHGYISQFRVSV